LKFIKLLLLAIIFLVAVGYGIYYFGTNIASEKIVETVSSELENSGEMENIKQTVESDPEIKAFLEDAKSVEESTLPFTTKEEATRVIVKKVGITELQDIQSRVKQGTISKEEIIQEIQGKLTEEEIMALKVIAYKELNKK
jgi:hypothetical protein